MSQRAEELLKRLAACEPEDGLEVATLIHQARAYLARERGPVAEGFVAFSERNGAWRARICTPSAGVPFRIPVPRHLWQREVLEGEVAEGDARTALEPEER